MHKDIAVAGRIEGKAMQDIPLPLQLIGIDPRITLACPRTKIGGTGKQAVATQVLYPPNPGAPCPGGTGVR